MPKASRGAVRRASCLKSRSITLLCQSSIQRLRERTFLLIDCRPSSKSAPYQITATATVISHTPSLGDRVVPVGVLRAADTTHAYEDGRRRDNSKNDRERRRERHLQRLERDKSVQRFVSPPARPLVATRSHQGHLLCYVGRLTSTLGC